ncbi:MAG TPA: carboxypeptidase-like regulatory domain-containing protein, partial [Kribbellaceae bacterium]|nr:carboxypeptidase-like regulatory domain-containing protein [Kribbellaceae bacterium]
MSRAVPKRLGLAAVILITAMMGLSAIPAFADPGTGSIGGHLMDGDTPISAFVVAYSPDNSWIAETFTDENGFYRLDGLTPGDYKVGFRLPGFVSQYAHQKLSLDAADLITVGDGEEVLLDEQVLPHGSIGGQVTTSTGEPSPNPYILVYRDFDLFAQNAGDAEGNYVVPY